MLRFWIAVLSVTWWTAETHATQRALVAQGGRPDIAHTVAAQITQWAPQLDLEPAWVVGIIAVENRDLRPGVRSRAGALGIMQVMPMHARTYAAQCGGSDLRDPAVNTCVGMHLLATYRPANGSRVVAQTRYLGCPPSRCPSYHRAVAQYTERASAVRGASN